MAVISVTVKDKNGLTATATAVADVTVPSGFPDGSANAPATAPQRPTLLDAYQISRRPPWQVAGVHYGVGYPDGLVLKAPVSLPGVTVSGGTVTITGNNVTLDGYNFSGKSIFVQGQNARIIRCKLNSLYTHYTTGNGSNLYIGYCVVDSGNSSTLIDMNWPGLTVEYCWLKNAGGDIFDRRGNSGGDINIRYNLIEQAGMGGAAVHGDYIQCLTGLNVVNIVYNTTYQNGGITQGFMVEQEKSGEISNNTFVGTVSYFVGLQSSSLTGNFYVRENYFDPKGYGFAHPYTGGSLPGDSNPKSIFTHNVNMVTGAIVQD